jgi:hypothetical protein
LYGSNLSIEMLSTLRSCLIVANSQSISACSTQLLAWPTSPQLGRLDLYRNRIADSGVGRLAEARMVWEIWDPLGPFGTLWDPSFTFALHLSTGRASVWPFGLVHASAEPSAEFRKDRKVGLPGRLCQAREKAFAAENFGDLSCSAKAQTLGEPLWHKGSNAAA